MSGPYRTPGTPEPDEPPPSTEPRKVSAGDLGPLRSSHERPGTVATLIAGWGTVDVHDAGLVFHGGFVDQRVMGFDDIDAIHFAFESLIPGRPRVDLVTFDGERLSIPGLVADFDTLLEALDRKVTWPIIRRAKEAFASGERLVFGPLTLELDGIVLQGESLSWSGLARVSAEYDCFVFYATEPLGRFGWVRVSEIPHPKALLELLRMRTRVVMSGSRL